MFYNWYIFSIHLLMSVVHIDFIFMVFIDILCILDVASNIAHTSNVAHYVVSDV